MRLKLQHEVTFSLKVGYMLRKCNNYKLSKKYVCNSISIFKLKVCMEILCRNIPNNIFGTCTTDIYLVMIIFYCNQKNKHLAVNFSFIENINIYIIS